MNPLPRRKSLRENTFYVIKLDVTFSTEGAHEVFTATALLTVVGVALLMELVGLSMALGAVLAPSGQHVRRQPKPISSPSRGCFSACSSWQSG